jgi:TonB family protein
MSDNFTGWVFDRGMPRNAGYTSVGVDFGGGGAPVEKNMASFFSRRLNLRESEFAVKRDELEKSAQSGVISLNAKERLSISFRVPELHDALAVLDDCVADLLATWGFSRDRQKEMSQRPETVRPFASYVSGTDYPMEALREDQTGENSARFQIHADGKTSDCKIVESSRSTALDSALCNVVRRLRYRPALNHAGQPMDSIGFLRIRWQLA